jgi:hypothetical protein
MARAMMMAAVSPQKQKVAIKTPGKTMVLSFQSRPATSALTGKAGQSRAKLRLTDDPFVKPA